ncbi:MAG: Asp-tRNA(Asn)/Glu-tRNA(Gln) amidotransferase subunit GatB [bacterium]|nr:Asp-tRNA(Asn)/Glu-tRNA(Gln) amidotransferase subunit GatB [bacterium]
MKYETTIGLEIHAELNTRTKMFCGSPNNPDEKRPNVNVCPVCMGHPGTLPVINKEAVKKVLMVGKALGGRLAERSRFDRKNYFYPDLPKGYQISQYKYPLVSGGELNGVKITRVHLEEDTGKLVHGKDGSLVDFNRAGLPLMELVTEPDIKSGEEARKFAEELRLIFLCLGVSDANMEKGQMRVEANISIKPANLEIESPSSLGDSISKLGQLGTKVEVKNLNSFRAVERAINYEIERQARALDVGEKIIQETRGWNEDKQETFSQREKEESHDYRYFPEPDLPALNLTNLDLGDMPTPELPQQKRERFKKEYGLNGEQTEVFIRDKKFADYFEEVAAELPHLDTKCPSGELISLAANYLTTDLQSIMKDAGGGPAFENLPASPKNFAKLIAMIKTGEIGSRAGKDVLKIMVEKGGDPSSIVDEMGLKQTSDAAAIEKLADKIIVENPTEAEGYKSGKEALLQFLVGQGMKETRGSVNPKILGETLEKKLK